MSPAFSIAKALRGRSAGGGSYLIRCPVPSHGNGKGDRNPSLTIKDGDKPGRVLVHCYAGCDSLDILAELRRRNFLEDGDQSEPPGPATTPDPTPMHEPDPEALKIWRGSAAISAEHEAARFLAARGLVGSAPPSLRATSLLHLEQYPFPAMVAAVQAPERNIIAVQTTLIDPRGNRKAQVRVPRKTERSAGAPCGSRPPVRPSAWRRAPKRRSRRCSCLAFRAGRRWVADGCTASGCRPP
jgi:putative DNA primase/helicase